MKLYTLARKTSICYGQGLDVEELRICKMGEFGSGEFPPLFGSEAKAQEYLESLGWADGYYMSVVSLTLI